MIYPWEAQMGLVPVEDPLANECHNAQIGT